MSAHARRIPTEILCGRSQWYCGLNNFVFIFYHTCCHTLLRFFYWLDLNDSVVHSALKLKAFAVKNRYLNIVRVRVVVIAIRTQVGKVALKSRIIRILYYYALFDSAISSFDLYEEILVHFVLLYSAIARYSVAVVEPLIEPLNVRLPADVVTVQSPVCADGVPSSVFTHTIFSVIFEFVTVCGSELNAAMLTGSTGYFFEYNVVVVFPTVTEPISSPLVCVWVTDISSGMLADLITPL